MRYKQPELIALDEGLIAAGFKTNTINPIILAVLKGKASPVKISAASGVTLTNLTAAINATDFTDIKTQMDLYDKNYTPDLKDVYNGDMDYLVSPLRSGLPIGLCKSIEGVIKGSGKILDTYMLAFEADGYEAESRSIGIKIIRATGFYKPKKGRRMNYRELQFSSGFIKVLSRTKKPIEITVNATFYRGFHGENNNISLGFNNGFVNINGKENPKVDSNVASWLARLAVYLNE